MGKVAIPCGWIKCAMCHESLEGAKLEEYNKDQGYCCVLVCQHCGAKNKIMLGSAGTGGGGGKGHLEYGAQGHSGGGGSGSSTGTTMVAYPADIPHTSAAAEHFINTAVDFNDPENWKCPSIT